MPWTNYHTHSHYCDGAGAPVLYAQAARQAGMRAMGFSSHAPVPYETDWTMPPERLDEYLREIEDLRKKMAGHIDIFAGLEIDYLPGIMGPTSEHFNDLGLDYRIGSIHFLHRPESQEPWTIDNTVAELTNGIVRDYGGRARDAVEEYYRRIGDMARHHRPDIVGHLDLIKKNNSANRYFSQDDAWYRRAVFAALKAIAESGAIVEINTGGIARGKIDDLYPSGWILERCRDLAIPITLNSDCHRPEQIAACFSQAARRLRDMGFEVLHTLGDDGWRPVAFGPEGLGDGK